MSETKQEHTLFQVTMSLIVGVYSSKLVTLSQSTLLSCLLLTSSSVIAKYIGSISGFQHCKPIIIASILSGSYCSKEMISILVLYQDYNIVYYILFVLV